MDKSQATSVCKLFYDAYIDGYLLSVGTSNPNYFKLLVKAVAYSPYFKSSIDDIKRNSIGLPDEYVDGLVHSAKKYAIKIAEAVYIHLELLQKRKREKYLSYRQYKEEFRSAFFDDGVIDYLCRNSHSEIVGIQEAVSKVSYYDAITHHDKK